MADMLDKIEDMLPKGIGITLIVGALISIFAAQFAPIVGAIAALMLVSLFSLQAREHSTGGVKAAWELVVVVLLGVVAAGALGLPGLSTISQTIVTNFAFFAGVVTLVGYAAAGAATGLFIKTLGGVING